VGDEVLREVTRRLSSVVRAGDLPARVGGDELAIFMPDLPDDAAAADLARRLVAALHDPLLIGGVPISVGLSIGIAVFPANGQVAADLLDAADQAMYRAKQQGGGYAYHTAGVTAQVARQQRLARDLLLAVRNDQLICAFQPIFTAKTHQPVAVEALVRWRHPQLGVISPAEWLSLAKRFDLLPSLTPTIIEHALRELPGWRKLGWSPRVAVNISAGEWMGNDIPKTLLECMAKCGVKAADVDLEIDENLLGIPQAVEYLLQLKKMGMGIVLDDNNGGYPTLPTLNRLPFTRVKVDRMVIAQLTRSPRELELFSAFVGLAHRMQVQVIAEGVETEVQARAIVATGCDLLQGHYFAPAQDSDMLVRRIMQSYTRPQSAPAGQIP
jgi:predicted signal transduction protein with EAL and GGDEF domain